MNPLLATGDYGWMESGPVLGWYVDEWIIVKLEQVDEDCPPKWYTCCSERWEIGCPEVWQNLPDNPNK